MNQVHAPNLAVVSSCNKKTTDLVTLLDQPSKCYNENIIQMFHHTMFETNAQMDTRVPMTIIRDLNVALTCL